jgi:hypothetical protein
LGMNLTSIFMSDSAGIDIDLLNIYITIFIHVIHRWALARSSFSTIISCCPTMIPVFWWSRVVTFIHEHNKRQLPKFRAWRGHISPIWSVRPCSTLQRLFPSTSREKSSSSVAKPPFVAWIWHATDVASAIFGTCGVLETWYLCFFPN